MKKVFALLMVAAMFSVVACEAKKETTSEGADTVKVAEPAAPAVDTVATPTDTVKTAEPATPAK